MGGVRQFSCRVVVQRNGLPGYFTRRAYSVSQCRWLFVALGNFAVIMRSAVLQQLFFPVKGFYFVGVVRPAIAVKFQVFFDNPEFVVD